MLNRVLFEWKVDYVNNYRKNYRVIRLRSASALLYKSQHNCDLYRDYSLL